MQLPNTFRKYIYETQARKKLALNLLVGILLIVVTSLGVISYSLIKEYQKKGDGIEEIQDKIFNQETEDPRQWEISKIVPMESSNLVNLIVKSNIGNIRQYDSVRSYGLSKSGKYLAFNSNEGMFVVELSSNQRKEVDVPSAKYFGDSGEFISWNGDEYFATSEIINESKETRLWIFNYTGSLIKDIEVDIPTRTAGQSLIEKVLFSNDEELIAVRTYKKEDGEFKMEDGSNYSTYQLPIYLTIFNLQGLVVKEINLTDYENNEKELYFAWENGFIKYLVYNVGEKPDLSRDYLFTKVSI